MSLKSEFLTYLTPLRGPLTAYCTRMLWIREDLEDALQETMMTAYRKFGDFEKGSDFRAWIFRIATWTCFSLNRKSARFPESSETIEVATPAAVPGDFDDTVRKALDTLTEKERSILLLKAIAGLSCEEIAGTLEVPLGTAQGLLTRARHKMKERLGVPA